MKCPHCGSPIRLEDKYCSYCGLPNDLAVQHQKDMNRYQKKFNQTRSEVLDSTRRTRKKIGSFVVLAVMALLILLSFQVEEYSWDLGIYIQKLQIQAHKQQHISAIEQFIDEQDPIGLADYYERYSLYLNDDFYCYRAVQSASSYFGNVFQSVSEYLASPDSYDSAYADRSLRYTVEYLNNIFQVEESFDYDTDQFFAGNRLEYIHAVQEDAKALLTGYFGLTADEADSFADLSASRQYELLERNLPSS